MSSSCASNRAGASRHTSRRRRPGGLRWPLRPRDHDVLFYTPWIGSIVSRDEMPPPGGAETQILMLAKALVQRGLRVAIVAYGRPSHLPREVDGVRIVARPPYRKRSLVGMLTETLIIWQSLWRAPSHAVVYRGVGFELGLLALYTRIARRCLIYSSANVIDFNCRRLLVNHRAAVIAAIMYERGVRLASAIVVQTEEQIPLCQNAFGRIPTLIKSIAPLADAQADVPEAFFWVGRFVSYKRPLEYLDLADAMPEARFWMVGVPAILEDEQRVAESVITRAREIPNLELLSPRPHPEIQALMARAVASVSTADFEGMPNVLLEAWARGVPALVLNHDPGGVVRNHGLGGFANGSCQELLELARQQWAARADRSARTAIARRCLAYIQIHHSPDAVAEQWARLLGRLEPAASRDKSVAGVELTCAG